MVASRLPSLLVALCHPSARPIRGRASLKWSSLTISDSRASLLSIFKGDVKSKRKSKARALASPHLLVEDKVIPAFAGITVLLLVAKRLLAVHSVLDEVVDYFWLGEG
jgi:hypothetical protein